MSVIVCAAGPAKAIGSFITLAQERGGTVQVIATPAALDFFDQAAVEQQTGSPVKSQYSTPGAPRSHIPDAIVVAPATCNTINKWAQGISDAYALGVLAEISGVDTPIVVLPSSTRHWLAVPGSAAASNPSAAKGCASCPAPVGSNRTRPALAAARGWRTARVLSWWRHRMTGPRSLLSGPSRGHDGWRGFACWLPLTWRLSTAVPGTEITCASTAAARLWPRSTS